MKNIWLALILLLPLSAVAQDFTHITKSVGKYTGKTLRFLIECKAPTNITTQFESVTSQMFKNAYPDDSYLAYKELYRKNYDIGVSEAVVEFKKEKSIGSEKSLCERAIEEAKTIISY